MTLEKKSFQKLRKKLLHQVGRAIQEYKMIEEGDKIMVAVSGGKDSWGLLYLLRELQKSSPVSFSLLAVHLDQGEPLTVTDKIEEALAQQDVPYRIFYRKIYDLIEAKLKEGDNRCSLCSRLRRGALYNIAHELGFSKIALGHHRDDLIITSLLNQFYTGTFASMPPRLESDDGRNVVIRPLCLVAEDDLLLLSHHLGFFISPCLNCQSIDNKRTFISKLLRQLEREIPNVKQTLLRSLSNVRPSQLLDKDLHPFD